VRSAILLLALGIGWPAAAQARAPNPRQSAAQKKLERAAKQRFFRGTRAYELGRYRMALRHYQAAAALVWRPSLAYNIALCHDKLKEFNQAIINLRRYLRSKPPKKWAERTRRMIRRLMKSAKVTVRVTSFPSGAAVYVNGKAKGVRGRTPASLTLKPGKYLMLVEATGHEPLRKRIRVDVGAKNYLDFQLKRRSALKVATSVAGALVSIDGGSATLAPLRRVVRAGRHRIEVRREGYYTVSRVVVIGAGEQSSVFVDLRPRPRHGYLRVKAQVSGATVRVESEEVGQTPVQRYRLRVGTYRVYVTKKGYQTWEKRITIVSRQVTTVSVRLSPKRSKRQVAWFVGGAVVTGLALVAGVGTTLAAINASNAYDDLPTASLRQNGRKLTLAADSLFAVGLVFGVLTGILTWQLRPAPSKADVAVAPMLGPGFVGVSAGGKF
jgi:PEGA domain